MTKIVFFLTGDGVWKDPEAASLYLVGYTFARRPSRKEKL
jgi:hypothetical protein